MNTNDALSQTASATTPIPGTDQGTSNAAVVWLRPAHEGRFRSICAAPGIGV